MFTKVLILKFSFKYYIFKYICQVAQNKGQCELPFRKAISKCLLLCKCAGNAVKEAVYTSKTDYDVDDLFKLSKSY